jgi:lipopolysaccharide transport system ATP-binding protein
VSLAVRVEDLSKSHSLRLKFSGQPDDKLFWALRDITLDVPQGEVLGIMGHNGAGKSTLLKILSQITSPTKGRVLIRGRVASLLEVGTGFHLELTGRENTFLNGAILGMTRREVAQKFDDIVGFAEIAEFIDTPVKRYSSGMRVRLAFAIAAHLDPEVMIIDEVLAVGDANFQARCIGKIGEVAGKGRTVLFVSHNAAAIESLCTRGIVLNHGQMVFDGTQTEAVRHYAQLLEGTPGALRERADRSGSGEVRLVSVDFRVRGEMVSTVQCGDDLEILLGFECTGANRFPQLIADIHFTTHVGAIVSSQSNWYTGESFGALPDKGVLICRIPRVPLIHGVYRLDISLYQRRRRTEALDELRHAADLRVIQGDFYESGRLPGPKDGPTLLEGSWSMRAAGD